MLTSIKAQIFGAIVRHNNKKVIKLREKALLIEEQAERLMSRNIKTAIRWKVVEADLIAERTARAQALKIQRA